MKLEDLIEKHRAIHLNHMEDVMGRYKDKINTTNDPDIKNIYSKHLTRLQGIHKKVKSGEWTPIIEKGRK